MDVYVFIQTEAGRALEVMDEVVRDGKASRAAVITGEWDVLARIDGIDWDDVLDRVTEIAGIEGVVSTNTSAAIRFEEQDPGLPPVPMPVKLPPPPPPDDRMAFVGVELSSAADSETLRQIGRNADVMGAVLLTGPTDVLVQVKGSSPADIVSTVVSAIRSLPGVESTSTSLILAVTELGVTS